MPADPDHAPVADADEQGDICPASKRYPCDPVCERCGRAMDYPAAPGPDRAGKLLRELVQFEDDTNAGVLDLNKRRDLWARARALVEDSEHG